MAYQAISLINNVRTNPDRSINQLYNDLKSAYKGNDLYAFGKRI